MRLRAGTGGATGVRRRPSLTVIACGAIGREMADVLALQGLVDVRIIGLPAVLHNRPDRIPIAVAEVIIDVRSSHPEARILVGYADCGTKGALADLCHAEGVDLLPGAHCYELFAGHQQFMGFHDAEPGTFFLTDYLVRNFDRLVVASLGLDRHPELRDAYFGNYRLALHLAQADDPGLRQAGQQAAERLGLEYRRVVTGLEPFASSVASLPVVHHAAA